MLLHQWLSMSNQTFVKNTNTPPKSSPLWTVGEGWKTSKNGNDYTKLAQITDVDLGVALCKQIEATRKEPIEYVKHYFVPNQAQDGNFLVYAFQDLKSAEGKAKYEKAGTVPAELDFRVEGQIEEVTTRGEDQNQVSKQLPIQTSNTAASSTIETTKPKTTGRTIEVVTDVTPIKVGDISAIGEAEQRGLYVLPIIHVGNNRFCFENKDGDYILLYGRIINVKVGDN